MQILPQADQGGTEAGGLVQPIHDDLRSRIIDLALPPGATLRTKELAEAYGVSPTPVRAALILLQQESLVRIYPQSRTVVAPISQADLSEVHFLRVAVETEVTRLLGGSCPEDVLARARSALRLQEIAAFSGRQDRFRHYGDLFHRALFEGIGRGGLHRMIRQRSGHMERVERLDPEAADPQEAALEAHDDILRAFARRDPARAESAMRRHLNPVFARIGLLQDRYPRYFSG